MTIHQPAFMLDMFSARNFSKVKIVEYYCGLTFHVYKTKQRHETKTYGEVNRQPTPQFFESGQASNTREWQTTMERALIFISPELLGAIQDFSDSSYF